MIKVKYLKQYTKLKTKQCYRSVSIVQCNETKCVVYTSDQDMSSTEQPTTRCPDVKKIQVNVTTEAYRYVLQFSDMQTVQKAYVDS